MPFKKDLMTGATIAVTLLTATVITPTPATAAEPAVTADALIAETPFARTNDRTKSIVPAPFPRTNERTTTPRQHPVGHRLYQL